MTSLWHLLCLLLFFIAQNAISQSQTVFSLEVTVGNRDTVFNFDREKFTWFYNCLCSPENRQCVAYSHPAVVYVTSFTEYGKNNLLRFICEQNNNDTICERRVVSDSFSYGRNLTSFTIQNMTCPQYVPFSWDRTQTVKVYSDRSLVTVYSFKDNDLSDVFHLEYHEVNNSVITEPSLKPSLPWTSGRQQDEHDEGKISIIIGVVVGIAVAAAIIISVVIFLWRRKKKFSSSCTVTANIKNGETDIYPYGDSSTNNMAPNLSPPSIDLASNMYATVDLNKKPRRTNPSSGTNNAHNEDTNILKLRNKPLYPPREYTKTVSDTHSDHYQGTSDVHAVSENPNGKVRAPDPSGSTEKSKICNSCSKSGGMLRKANNVKYSVGGTTINETGTYSGDCGYNGYEFAKPIFDTRYPLVDLTTKTKYKPADEGVYSSAHEDHAPSGTAAKCSSVIPSTKIKQEPASKEICSSGYEEVNPHDNRYTSVYVSAKTSSKPASNDVLPVKNKPEPASKDVHSDGYEKAKPHHDNGYMIVDLSSDKEHTVPAADGVYSKLHHPVRNLTNVYNEWSA